MDIPSVEKLKETCRLAIPKFAIDEQPEMVEVLITAACEVLRSEMERYIATNLTEADSAEFRRAWLGQFANLFSDYKPQGSEPDPDTKLNEKIVGWLTARGTRMAKIEIGRGLGLTVTDGIANAAGDELKIFAAGEKVTGWWLDFNYPDFYPTSDELRPSLNNIHTSLVTTLPPITDPTYYSKALIKVDGVDMTYAYLFPVDLASVTIILYKGITDYDRSAENFWKARQDAQMLQFIEENFLSDLTCNLFIQYGQYTAPFELTDAT